MKNIILAILLIVINNVMAQEITTVKVNELATRSLNSSDYFIKGEGSLMYKNTLGTLANFIGGVGVLGYKGALAIADTPTEDGFYFASESGTYSNAGGLVTDLSQGINIISVMDTQTVFDLVVVPVDLSSQLANTVDPLDTTKAVTGVAVDTFAKSDIKGFSVNKGVKFPTYGIETQQPTSGASILEVNARFVYNVMLDFKVINAKKGHVYRIKFFGNNFGSQGDRIQIEEMLQDGTLVRVVVDTQPGFVAPVDHSKPGSFSIESEDGIIFIITADYSTENGNRFVSNEEANGFFHDYIDPSRYVYADDYNPANQNHWKDKTIVTLGTSVIFGRQTDPKRSYIVEAQKKLGFNLIQTGLAGQAIHAVDDGAGGLEPMEHGSSVLSIQEYADNGWTIDAQPIPFEPNGSYNDYYRTWENIFRPENSNADLYLYAVVPNNNNFDLTDWNDFDIETWSYNTGTFEDHRTTFLGALIFLFNKMYEVNPTARAVLLIDSSFNYPEGLADVKRFAEAFNMPLIDMWGESNYNPKTQSYLYSQSGTNPHPSALAHELMGEALVNKLLSIR